MHKVALVLHDIRSAHNVGSIFRTADAAGVSALYLTGLTPAPRDRFGRVQKQIAKVALGAENMMQWEAYASAPRLLKKLRKEKWEIVGVEQDARSRDYRTFKPRAKTVLVFGNEVRGLPQAIRDYCDQLIEIPMRGEKESLNVSVAAGIVLFAMSAQ